MVSNFKTCSICKETKSPDNFSKHSSYKDHLRAYCKLCAVKISQEYKRKNPDWELTYRLKRKYGMSKTDFDEMMDIQKNGCAICKEQFDSKTRGRICCVDHDHNTDKVRGLLCFNCNTALGQFKDSTLRLKSAISYLENNE